MSATHDDHHHGPSWLAHHFFTPIQQFDAAKLGMWAFLAQEILFFAGLFVAYGIYRTWYPESFSVGSHMLDWRWGGLNTCVLLFSSLTAALAVRSAQLGEKKKTSMLLLITIACAFGFMIIKYIEYSHKIHLGILPAKFFLCPGFECVPPEGAAALEHWNQAKGEAMSEIATAVGASYQGEGIPFHLRSFFGIYFIMTGLHGLHVVIGIGILFWIWRRNERGEFGPEHFTAVDIAALYWHLVDLIWIFLFPLLYLID